jgi:ribosomal protein S18 acetylase RimI-like enzyme
MWGMSRGAMKRITLRVATAGDRAFLYDLHCASLKGYITGTWGWDETWQRGHFDKHFDPERRQIIQWENRDIGAIGVSERDADILIDYIALYPEHQRQGIGSHLIKTIIEHGVAEGKPIRLRVLRTNPAFRLYERLGFMVEEESDTHIQMIRPIDAAITNSERTF